MTRSPLLTRRDAAAAPPPCRSMARHGQAGDDAARANPRFASLSFAHDLSRTPLHSNLAAARRMSPGAGQGLTTWSNTVSRDGDVETVTETVRPASPVGPPAVNHCAITGATFTSIPSGTVAATLSGGRLQAPFVMRATFSNAIPCTCANGEYRQYIRGSFTAGGSPVTHMLGPGRPLSATTFQEDGDVGAGTAYGYHSSPGTKSRFKPDQATGCQFEGEDEPGISAASGNAVSVNLDFRGDLIDTADANRVVTTASWTVSGSATMP